MASVKPASGEVPVAETARQQLARLADSPDLPLPEVFRRVCEAAAETLRVERAGIWLFVNNDSVLRCVNLFERSTRRHTKGACLALNDCPTFLQAIADEPLLPCESACTDPRTAELASSYFAPLNINSTLDAPLLRDDRLVGVVCCEHVGAPRSWSEADRSFALALAAFVVKRMRSVEGALKASSPRTHFVVVPPAVPAATRLAHELKDLLAEIEVLARSAAKAGTPERLRRIADAAARSSGIVRKIFDTPTEAAGMDTVPNDDDTGEHTALPAAS